MCNTCDTKKNKATEIAEFLINNENVCLVIQGAWGIGKF